MWKPDYVTLVQAKDFMRITDDDDDDTVAVAITAASRAIDDYCNRQFGQAVAVEERFYTPWYDYECGRWVVDVDDLQTATGLVVTVTDVGTAVAADYVKEHVNAVAEGKAWTRLRFVASPTVLPTGARHEIAVTALWGWTTVPTAVVAATYLQTSRFHARRDSPFGIAGSPDNGSELRLLARVDPDVAVSLRGLVRPRRAA
jgi:hypothetical protein